MRCDLTGSSSADSSLTGSRIMELAHLSGPNYGMMRSVVARDVAGLFTQHSRHAVFGMLAHRDGR